MRVLGLVTLGLLLAGISRLAAFSQEAGQTDGNTVVISWKEGGLGAETVEGVKVLTANGVRVAVVVDHAARDIDRWYGNSVLRVQIKAFNNTTSPVAFDPLTTRLRDSRALIEPLSFAEALKLSPKPANPASVSRSGPTTYSPPSGPAQDQGSQQDQQRSAERAHSQEQEQQWRRSEEQRRQTEIGQTQGSAGLKLNSSFYETRRIEPAQSLFGALYFKAPKLSKEFIVRIPVGQAVYEIPFSNPR